MPELPDLLAIHELLALYGHVIDSREWHRVGELFTATSVYDMSAFGLGIVHGATAIRELWSRPGAAHPLAHHSTNVVIREADDGSVHVLSKGIGVGEGGRVGSVVYRDVVTKGPGGWRFAVRTVKLLG